MNDKKQAKARLVLTTKQNPKLCQIKGAARYPIRIVCPEVPSIIEMASYLKRFLKERNCVVLSKPVRQVRGDYPGPQIVLATASTFAGVKSKMPPPQFGTTCRDEAYVLDVCAGDKHPVAILVGQSFPGVRAAVARFTCKIANDGKRLWLSEGREEHDPFIPLRLFLLGNSARRQTPFGSPFKDADYETWTRDRIRAYPELFWQFGFNGVQTGEYRGYGLGGYQGYTTMDAKALARIRTSVLTFLKAARRLHLFTSLFHWGDCLFEEGATHSWNHPDEHRTMRRYMADIVKAYGPYLDHFSIHIGDPGGCTRDGCDHYKTPQQITSAYLEKFRKINPKMQASFSTWANPHFWVHCPTKLDMLNYCRSVKDSVAGSKVYCSSKSELSNYKPMFGGVDPAEYVQTEQGVPVPEGAQFLDATFMPRDVGIALNRVYNESQADIIAASGRPVDIWGWYMTDMEMCNTYWLTMRSVDKMLGAYPDKVRHQVRSQALELTFHGWPQVINSYVGAQKLWNPRKPLAEIEREFCIAGFGPANAEAVLDLYKACENGVLDPLPRPRDFGTPAYHAKLARVIERAQTIKIPAGWKPNFAFPVPVPTLVDMLVARARLILAVSEAQGRVAKAKKRGASAEQIAKIKQRAVESLPNLPIDPIFRQDASIVRPEAKTESFAEIIEKF